MSKKAGPRPPEKSRKVFPAPQIKKITVKVSAHSARANDAEVSGDAEDPLNVIATGEYGKVPSGGGNVTVKISGHLEGPLTNQVGAGPALQKADGQSGKDTLPAPMMGSDVMRPETMRSDVMYPEVMPQAIPHEGTRDSRGLHHPEDHAAEVERAILELKEASLVTLGTMSAETAQSLTMSRATIARLEKEAPRGGGKPEQPQSLQMQEETVPAALPVRSPMPAGLSKDPLAGEDISDPQTAQEEQKAADVVSTLFTELLRNPDTDSKRFSAILDMLPCYVVLLDSQKRIVYANKSFHDYFGNTSLGEYCYTSIKGLQQPCAHCMPFDSFYSNSSCVMELVTPKSRHAFRVYSYAFNDPTDKKLLLEVGISVTASLRMRQALDFSESSYQAITDNLSVGVAVLTPQLFIKEGNMRLQGWFGAGFSKGRRVCDCLACNGISNIPTSADDYCPDCPFKYVIAGEKSHEKEFLVHLQDGREKMVRLVGWPVTPKRGHLSAVIMMLEDITERLAIHKHLQRVKNLEAMGTIAGGIAHEINQPLSAISLYTSGLQMLLEKSGEVSKDVVEERLTLILKESEKIRSIIANMRALVMKGGEVSLVPVSAAETLASAQQMLDHQFNARNIVIENLLPNDLPDVLSNAVQMEQVFINIFTNAIHAIDAKQTEAGKEPDDGQGKPIGDEGGSLIRQGIIRISGAVSADGKRVILAIADNGPGLPSANEKIFDPFFTTKEDSKGMGLGLAIVNRLVSQWKGGVSARAKDPALGGAVFYLSLQKAESPAQPL